MSKVSTYKMQADSEQCLECRQYRADPLFIHWQDRRLAAAGEQVGRKCRTLFTRTSYIPCGSDALWPASHLRISYTDQQPAMKKKENIYIYPSLFSVSI